MIDFSLVTLNSTNAEQVSKLRIEAYRNHFGERADIERLKWNENDERFVNIGLIRRRDRELVSILRLAFLKTPTDFYKVVLLKHSQRFELPLVALGRAATVATCQGHGLHSVLRWSALSLSKEAGAKSCVGTMEEGSPRLKQMAAIGYEFSSNDEPWQGYLKSKKPIIVGVLHSDHRLDRACEILASRIRERQITFADEIDHNMVTEKLLSTESFENEN